MGEKLAAAEILISEWDTNKTKRMLFESNPEEVGLYMATVENLHRLMEYYSSGSTNTAQLASAQRLMKIAMARLQNEFHKILLSNSDAIHPERLSSPGRPSSCSSREGSVTSSPFSDADDDANSCSSTDRTWDFSTVALDAVADLRNIAQLMAKTGYARECVRIFALTRRSVVEESLYNLGVEKVKLNGVRKMESEILDAKIRKWIYAAKISIRVLFARERQLCDDVFEGLDKIKDSCFAEIGKEGIERILAFAEAVAVTSRAPERMFRVLDLFHTLSHLMPDIEDTFSQATCGSVQQQGERILVHLGEAARAILMEFEKAVEKEKRKVAVPGANVHPLARYVMNYLSLLCDYKESLVNIITDTPEEVQKALPVSELNDSSVPLSSRLGWIVFMLTCKLDKKADLYNDVALSYLFLMNNLNYIIEKVNGSELRYILGEGWVRKQRNKVRHYAVKYEKAAWMKVMSCSSE